MTSAGCVTSCWPRAQDVVAAARAQLDRDQAKQRQILRCGTPEAEPGCQVTVRYLYQVLRGLPREMVFARSCLAVS